MPAPKVLEEIRAVPRAPLSAPVSFLLLQPQNYTTAVPPAPKQEVIKPTAEKTSFDEFARLGKNAAPSESPPLGTAVPKGGLSSASKNLLFSRRNRFRGQYQTRRILKSPRSLKMS